MSLLLKPPRLRSPALIISALCLLALGGGLFAAFQRAGVVGRRVAQVGQITIRDRDVAERQALLQARSGRPEPPSVALYQLIEEALTLEIGRAYQVEVTDHMLAEEAARVGQTSRDLQTLARIQAVFGGDTSAYRRGALRPILAGQLLQARFSLGHDIQAEPLSRAQAVLAEAQAGSTSLAELAAEYGGEFRLLELVDGRFQDSTRADIAPGGEDAFAVELASYGLSLPDAVGLFEEQVLAGLAPGELHPKVVEDRNSFQVVRLLERAGPGNARLESVLIAKLAFAPWFETQSLRIPLEVLDDKLKQAMLAEIDVPYITARLGGSP